MSTFDLIRRYLTERARLGAFVPLALLIALTGRVFNASGFGSLGGFLGAAGRAFVLVLAFRVWDDLEDRRRDARDHPDRVMAASKRTTPFVLLLLGLAIAGVAPAAFAPNAGAHLVPLDVAVGLLLAWYRLRGERSSVFGGYVVLLKYPAIAWVVAPALPPPLALVSLHVVVCVFETLDDRTLRASITSFFGHRVP